MILKDKDYRRNNKGIIKIIITMTTMIIIDQNITFISCTLQPGLQRDHKDPQVATRLSTLVSRVKIELGVEILRKVETCPPWFRDIKKCPFWFKISNYVKNIHLDIKRKIQRNITDWTGHGEAVKWMFYLSLFILFLDYYYWAGVFIFSILYFTDLHSPDDMSLPKGQPQGRPPKKHNKFSCQAHFNQIVWFLILTKVKTCPHVKY